ncbi:MAG: hypothetical protein D6730_16785 [Bacteroidetes bacterium]|nr:MAG: hypothetical protein D6730_16785 [Bacteroidota bacterium]
MRPNKIIPLVILTLTFIFSACQQENVAPESKQEKDKMEKEYGHYSKQLTLVDRSGKNSVTLNISSDIQRLLDKYSERTLKLEPVYRISTPSLPDNTQNSILEEIPNENSKIIHIHPISSSLESGAIGFKVTFQTDNLKDASRADYEEIRLYSDGWRSTGARLNYPEYGIDLQVKVHYKKNGGIFWKKITEGIADNEGEQVTGCIVGNKIKKLRLQVNFLNCCYANWTALWSTTCL